jgi:hypothetical protein
MKKERKILIILFMLLMPIVVCGQTKLYKQYQHRKDITVACAMAFPITDSVKVDVTILAPKTKEAVYTLVEEFNLGIEKDIIDNRFGQEERYSLYTRNVCKDDIKKRFGEIKSDEDYKKIAILAYNYNMGTIVIFHDIENRERRLVINSFLMNTLNKSKTFPSVDNVNNKYK